ncbi:MAG: toll/interleukin-1 receptor domain-containing protein [Planctomycetia bacterium]|uniref:toll/interleukin-1 receptor domain-containing protein n=1 Tax=Candidatus Kuenenia sp. TaxID=2499824 RepID=UPI001D20E27B|nr:toll/interleukin-1 receptor domain-containing protein [Planctomycetia bacterium]MCL4743627.1 TIR domain-containing protein [Phycisphaerales bacterium]
MSGHGPNFELPKNVERYLATLSRLYAQEGKKLQQSIIVNAQVRVNEGWSYNNYLNGETYGHALYLAVPETLYLRLVKNRDVLQQQIREDINKLHNIQNEYIEVVFLEMEVTDDQDWRKESGLLMIGKRTISSEVASWVWGNEGYRVFLSHKNEVKKETAQLKEKLNLFGISGFVAHEDIHPTKEWQSEIENALFSMDAFVALMTEGFHDSFWTDQEVGVAFGRGVPIISVKLGNDPYGFIGKFQALSCSWDTAAKEIVKILVKHERMLNAYITAVENCSSYDNGNILSEILPCIDKLSNQQVNRLVAAYNENTELRGGFGFNGKKSYYYGDGLASHLSSLSGQTYSLSRSGKIEVL